MSLVQAPCDLLMDFNEGLGHVTGLFVYLSLVSDPALTPRAPSEDGSLQIPLVFIWSFSPSLLYRLSLRKGDGRPYKQAVCEMYL